MSHPAQRAEARSRGFQLLAIAFGHPVEALHAQLVDGRYRDAFDAARRQLQDYVRIRRGKVKHHESWREES